jgi:hypothetical protein
VTPLQKIAMGLVIVVVAAKFGAGWDGLPNPLGWLLILAGVRDARDHLPSTMSLMILGGIALVLSALTYPPTVTDGLDPAATWLLDLPQVAFEVVLCTSLAPLVGRSGQLFRWLVWLLIGVGIGPAVAIAVDDPAVADAVLAAWFITQLALIWLLFSVSTLPETGAKPRPVRLTSQPEGKNHDNSGPESLS